MEVTMPFIGNREREDNHRQKGSSTNLKSKSVNDYRIFSVASAIAANAAVNSFKRSTTNRKMRLCMVNY